MVHIEMTREPREAEYQFTVTQTELDFMTWALGNCSPVDAERFEMSEPEFNDFHDTLLDKAAQINPREDIK